MDSMQLQSSKNYKPGLKFRLGVRLFLICFFGCVTAYLALASPYWLASIWTAFITAGLYFEAIRFLTSSERKIENFLQALSQGDFTMTFPQHPGVDDYHLHEALNQLNATYKRVRSYRESEHQLLQIIVEHAGVPIICFEEGNDEVYLVNQAAKNLLKVPILRRLEGLGRVNTELPGFLRSVQDGEKETFRLELSGKLISLSVNSRHVLFQDRRLKLIALHDVSSELALKEAETWQKLLRVLTHEISNSAIPLSTLSAYLHDVMIEAARQRRELSDEERQDVMVSLRTIDQRSRALKEFVQNIKSISQVPEPRLQATPLAEIVQASVQLYSKDFRTSKIEIKLLIPDDLIVVADATLTQQVIINIIKNAAESMTDIARNRIIDISAYKDDQRYAYLTVRDFGRGIAPEDMDQIFIPFFSTKKGGSGIGLSISKQIMQRQKGDISVRSLQGEGSAFTLTFCC